MPGWIIELFGSAQLERAFWWITLIPLPLWIALILFQKQAWFAYIAHPLTLPLLPIPLWGYIIYQIITVFGSPGFQEVTFSDTRDFLGHPLIFLALWTQLQIVNLFVGVTIYQHGRQAKINVTVELILAWILAPIAILICAFRFGLKKWF